MRNPGFRKIVFGGGRFFCLLCVFVASCAEVNAPRDEQREMPAWKRLGPGGGGSTFIPTFSFGSPDSLVIRCDMTGSYFTRDGGESWRQVNFPNGAGSFAYDPRNSSIIYIGSATLNRSVNGGETWQPIFPAPDEIIGETYRGDHATYSVRTVSTSTYDSTAGGISNICVDPVNGAVFFSMGRSFYIPQDGGDWKKIAMAGEIDLIYTDNTRHSGEVLVFMPDRIAIYNKATGTVTERDIPSDMQPASGFSGGVSKDGLKSIFYALHYTGEADGEGFRESSVWVSSDAGNSWKKCTDDLLVTTEGGKMPGFSMISAAAGDAEHAYLVCDRYLEKKGDSLLHWYGALATRDGGQHWSWVLRGGGGSGQYGVKDGTGFSNLRDAWVEPAFGGEYIRLLDAGVYPMNGDVAVVTDWYRVMRTEDGGRTWREVYSIRNADGSFTSRGLDVTTAYGVHFDPFDSSHVAVSYTDIGYHHSFDSGAGWVRSVSGVPSTWQNTCYWVLFDPDIRGKVWSAWSNLHDFPRGKMTRDPQWRKRARGGVCVSTDGGRTWKSSSRAMGDDSPATSIVLDPQSRPGARTLYAAVYNKGVFKSADDGNTWTLKNNGLGENTAAFELTINERGDLFLIVTPVPAHRGGRSGQEFFPGAVFRSTDGAESWTKLTITDRPLLFPNGFACDPRDPDRLYVACWSDIYLSDIIGGSVARSTGGDELIRTEGGIFMSEDGGVSWTSVMDRNYYVYDVTPDPYHEGRVYCNTFNSAAFRSDDGGRTWGRIPGYDFHWGHRVIADRWDHDKVYLTTFGSGVLRGTAGARQPRPF